MKTDEILDLWSGDSKIDKVNLSDESLSIAKLHHKYFKIYIDECRTLAALRARYNKLKLEKYEFFTQGPSEETKLKGWKMPAKGMILKSDVPMYMDADEDLTKCTLQINEQEHKVGLVDSIIKSFKERGWNIKNAIEIEKFRMGS